MCRRLNVVGASLVCTSPLRPFSVVEEHDILCCSVQGILTETLGDDSHKSLMKRNGDTISLQGGKKLRTISLTANNSQDNTLNIRSKNDAEDARKKCSIYAGNKRSAETTLKHTKSAKIKRANKRSAETTSAKTTSAETKPAGTKPAGEGGKSTIVIQTSDKDKILTVIDHKSFPNWVETNKDKFLPWTHQVRDILMKESSIITNGTVRRFMPDVILRNLVLFGHAAKSQSKGVSRLCDLFLNKSNIQMVKEKLKSIYKDSADIIETKKKINVGLKRKTLQGPIMRNGQTDTTLATSPTTALTTSPTNTQATALTTSMTTKSTINGSTISGLTTSSKSNGLTSTKCSTINETTINGSTISSNPNAKCSTIYETTINGSTISSNPNAKCSTIYETTINGLTISSNPNAKCSTINETTINGSAFSSETKFRAKHEINWYEQTCTKNGRERILMHILHDADNRWQADLQKLLSYVDRATMETVLDKYFIEKEVIIEPDATVELSYFSNELRTFWEKVPWYPRFLEGTTFNKMSCSLPSIISRTPYYVGCLMPTNKVLFFVGEDALYRYLLYVTKETLIEQCTGKFSAAQIEKILDSIVHHSCYLELYNYFRDLDVIMDKENGLPESNFAEALYHLERELQL